MRLQLQCHVIYGTFLLHTSNVTANLFRPRESDGICRNNREWSDEQTGELDCGDVGFVESRRVNLCQNEEIHKNCPMSCGVCCEDDPDYLFERDNDMMSGCSWLTANFNNKEVRIARYCDTYNNGIMVRAACPEACDYCKSYVSIAPSISPTTSVIPTITPSSFPTALPSVEPTLSNTPTELPSKKPSSKPSVIDSNVPSLSSGPSYQPSSNPTSQPSLQPTMYPSSVPSEFPSISKQPTIAPTFNPSLTMTPSAHESHTPSVSMSPIISPSSDPSFSIDPSGVPSSSPSDIHSLQPSMSMMPSTLPSNSPTVSISPSNLPSNNPTISAEPTMSPTGTPTLSANPSGSPSNIPSVSNTPTLTQAPSLSMRPSAAPSNVPSTTLSPSSLPSNIPTLSTEPSLLPTDTPTESENPSGSPSNIPSLSNAPTHTPTQAPSLSMRPSAVPSSSPSLSMQPSEKPSNNPTLSAEPTLSPTETPTMSANPSGAPSDIPTISDLPTLTPTQAPSSSMRPSIIPSSSPSVSMLPSDTPSLNPSVSILPSALPSSFPSASVSPSDIPSINPSGSTSPTALPSNYPSSSPSTAPSDTPSVQPSSPPTSSARPSSSPSKTPSKFPSVKPSPTPSMTPTLSPSQKPSEQPSAGPSESKPNLIMIITDEHNLRTLSVYRDYLLTKHEQTKVDVWGDVHLDTPNLDSLANAGALFTNFYTVSPLCTPSRASFMTGLYPPFTGAADQNHGKLDTNIKTWADILRDERGYTTSYMGKFHLDGEEKPGWGAPDGREFGFDDNKYRYNRGHWKYFDEVNGGVLEYEMDGEENFESRYNEHFATDFLVNRGMEFIENATNNDDPFALVLSIPDPHSPNDNRPYYRNMFKNFDFKVPETARKNMKFEPAAGGYNFFNKEEVPIDTVDDFIAEYEQHFFVDHMQQYYGMVKCIDYNIGKLLKKMRNLGIEDNTVVVFTSDHGDLLGEHGKLNKGQPYETSAGIPFIVKYPDKVPSGKIIETAYSSVDFAPTILSLMGVSALPSGVTFQGIDGSQELTNQQMVTANAEQIVFSFDTGNTPIWAAAIMDGYKLVVSKNGFPWLFDINRDPEELINYASSKWHRDIYVELREGMIHILKEYQVPLTEITKMIYLDVPTCADKDDVLPLNNGITAFCSDIGVTMDIGRCGKNKVSQHCPATCNACVCEDSPGMIWVGSHARRCDTLDLLCDNEQVQKFCPKTCGTC